VRPLAAIALGAAAPPGTEDGAFTSIFSTEDGNYTVSTEDGASIFSTEDGNYTVSTEEGASIFSTEERNYKVSTEEGASIFSTEERNYRCSTEKGASIVSTVGRASINSAGRGVFINSTERGASMNSAGKGVSINSTEKGASINSAGKGVSINSTERGASRTSAGKGVSINSTETGASRTSSCALGAASLALLRPRSSLIHGQPGATATITTGSSRASRESVRLYPHSHGDDTGGEGRRSSGLIRASRESVRSCPHSHGDDTGGEGRRSSVVLRDLEGCELTLVSAKIRRDLRAFNVDAMSHSTDPDGAGERLLSYNNIIYSRQHSSIVFEHVRIHFIPIPPSLGWHRGSHGRGKVDAGARSLTTISYIYCIYIL